MLFFNHEEQCDKPQKQSVPAHVNCVAKRASHAAAPLIQKQFRVKLLQYPDEHDNGSGQQKHSQCPLPVPPCLKQRRRDKIIDEIVDNRKQSKHPLVIVPKTVVWIHAKKRGERETRDKAKKRERERCHPRAVDRPVLIQQHGVADKQKQYKRPKNNDFRNDKRKNKRLRRDNERHKKRGVQQHLHRKFYVLSRHRSHVSYWSCLSYSAESAFSSSATISVYPGFSGTRLLKRR